MAPIRDPQDAARVERYVRKIQGAVGDVSRANNRLRREVATARDNGVSWAEVGAAIGMTPQGAQQRYGTRGDRADVRVAREAKRRAAREEASTAVDPWPDGTVQDTISDSD